MTHAEVSRAADTARRLVTCYLDNPDDFRREVRDVVRDESQAHVCLVLHVLVEAVGEGE